jgi:toxin ParE1/3/4
MLYRTDPDSDDGPVSAVEIIRVVNARRNLSALF